MPKINATISKKTPRLKVNLPGTLLAGIPGKSAYQFAVEGGYTGTEEEFAKKLASEYSGVSSWNDLPDRPFYSEPAFETIVFPDTFFDPSAAVPFLAPHHEPINLGPLVGAEELLFYKGNVQVSDVKNYFDATWHTEGDPNLKQDNFYVYDSGIELPDGTGLFTVSTEYKYSEGVWSTGFSAMLLVVSEENQLGVPTGVYVSPTRMEGYIIPNGTLSKTNHIPLPEEYLPKSVLTTNEQTLTEEQQTQARKNIGAVKSWEELPDKPFYTEKITDKTVFTSEEIFAVEPVNVGALVGVDYLPAYWFSDIVLADEHFAKTKIRDLFFPDKVPISIYLTGVEHYPELNVTSITFEMLAFNAGLMVVCVHDNTHMPKGMYLIPTWKFGYPEMVLTFTVELPQEIYHKISEKYVPAIFVARITENDGTLICDKPYSEILAHVLQNDVCIAVTSNAEVLNYATHWDGTIVFTGTISEFVNDDITFVKQAGMRVGYDGSVNFFQSGNTYFTFDGTLILQSNNSDKYFTVLVNDDGELYTEMKPI